MSFTILAPQRRAKIKGVLFDMDGVILDTEKLYARFWAEACVEYGFPMTHEQSLGMRGLSRNDGQAYLTKLFGSEIDYSVIRACMTERMDAFVETHGIETKNGAVELLKFLKEREIPCALTTSSPIERVQEQLGRLNLIRMFDQICSAFLVEHGKPEPDIYLYGAKSLGLEPEECLSAEDSYTGLLSAYRAGTMNVLVPDLVPADENDRHIAFALADSLSDLKEMIC